MSAIGQILDTVEGLLAPLRRHEKAQDARLDAVEKRLDALEGPAPEPVKKATAATARSATATAKAAGNK